MIILSSRSHFKCFKMWMFHLPIKKQLKYKQMKLTCQFFGPGSIGFEISKLRDIKTKLKKLQLKFYLSLKLVKNRCQCTLQEIMKVILIQNFSLV